MTKNIKVIGNLYHILLTKKCLVAWSWSTGSYITKISNLEVSNWNPFTSYWFFIHSLCI